MNAAERRATPRTRGRRLGRPSPRPILIARRGRGARSRRPGDAQRRLRHAEGRHGPCRTGGCRRPLLDIAVRTFECLRRLPCCRCMQAAAATRDRASACGCGQPNGAGQCVRPLPEPGGCGCSTRQSGARIAYLRPPLPHLAAGTLPARSCDPAAAAWTHPRSPFRGCAALAPSFPTLPSCSCRTLPRAQRCARRALRRLRPACWECAGFRADRPGAFRSARSPDRPMAFLLTACFEPCRQLSGGIRAHRGRAPSRGGPRGQDYRRERSRAA